MNPITDYQSLQGAVAGTVHRPNDANVTGNLPLWISLCEADLFHDGVLDQQEETEATLTLTTGQNYVALPAGYISDIALWILLSSGLRSYPTITKVQPEGLPYLTNNGLPVMYAIDGANIRFDRPIDAAYTTAYFRYVKESALSNSNTTNSILTARPDVYFYGTLKEAAIFTKDPDGPTWASLYEMKKKQAKATAARNRQTTSKTDLRSRGIYNIYSDNP